MHGNLDTRTSVSLSSCSRQTDPRKPNPPVMKIQLPSRASRMLSPVIAWHSLNLAICGLEILTRAFGALRGTGTTQQLVQNKFHYNSVHYTALNVSDAKHLATVVPVVLVVLVVNNLICPRPAGSLGRVVCYGRE